MPDIYSDIASREACRGKARSSLGAVLLVGVISCVNCELVTRVAAAGSRAGAGTHPHGSRGARSDLPSGTHCYREGDSMRCG